MKNLEHFYTSLNDSRYYPKGHALYKKHITNLLNETIDRYGIESFCMIGAGNLEDFNLTTIFSKLANVFLTDIDITNLERGLLNKGISKKALTLKQVEYTGALKTGILDEFMTQLNTCHSREDIDSFIQKVINALLQTTFLVEVKNSFDMVYISPIYTQLLYVPLTQIVDHLVGQGHSEELGRYTKSVILQKMMDVIHHFNQNCYALLKQGGILFVLSDVLELHHEDPLYHRVIKALPNDQLVDKIYQDYLETYGMGLGDFGLYDVSLNQEIISTKWLIWPKDEQISYLVNCKIIIKE